jgi:oxygen-dependent protoporphyrinogen oxidase
LVARGPARAAGARVAALRPARVAFVSLGFAPGAPPPLPEGFGYLVPPTEDGRDAPAPTALGTIFVTNLFPHRAPRGARSVASFYRAADVAQHDDAALARVAERDLGLAIGAAAPRAIVAHVERWSDVIPRHAPGHFALISRVRGALRERARGLHAAGAWVDGVSVEQVLTSGRAAADEVLKVREEMP